MRNIKVGFIGLGTMGFPMAGHLSKAGYKMTVFNRSEEKSSRWVVKHEGVRASDLKEVAENSDIIFTCVGSDKDLRDIYFSPQGIFEHLRSGQLVVDCTTASVGIAQDLANRLEKVKVGFVDAPVSGGDVGAQKGSLTCMVGASESNFEKAKPLLNCFSATVTHMGKVGSGQLTKTTNQIIHAGSIEAIAEALNFGKKMGLDMKKALRVMLKGSAYSWHLENRSERMLSGEYGAGFANKHIAKDLGLAIKTARENNLPLPITKSVLDRYKKLLKQGKDDQDYSSIIQLLE